MSSNQTTYTPVLIAGNSNLTDTAIIHKKEAEWGLVGGRIGGIEMTQPAGDTKRPDIMRYLTSSILGLPPGTGLTDS